MTDFRLVDVPVFFPQACLCGSQKRPIVDSGVEVGNGHRIYLCQLCAKLIAGAYGFTEGEELDRLMAAREERDGFLRELAAKDETIAAREGALVASDDQIRALEHELETACVEVANIERREQMIEASVEALAAARRREESHALLQKATAEAQAAEQEYSQAIASAEAKKEPLAAPAAPRKAQSRKRKTRTRAA